MFIVVYDEQGKILQVSPEFLDAVGHPANEVIGQELSRFLQLPATGDRIENRESKIGNRDPGPETQHPTPDTQHPGWVPIPESGGPATLLDRNGSSQDVVLQGITLKCADFVRRAFLGETIVAHALGLEAMSGRQALNNIEGAMLAENPDGIVTFANAKMLELVGYPEPELIGRHWSQIVPHDERRWVEQQLRVRLRGEHNQYETVVLTRAQNRIPVIVSARPITEDGRYLGTISTFTDITERKQAEYELRANSERMEQLNTTLNRQRVRLLELTDELARANEELQRLSEAKSDFVNQVSHDLRNPLHALLQTVDMVRDGSLGGINEEQGKWLKLALEDGDRLNELIGDILDKAKLETGKLVANKVRVGAEEHLNQVLHTYDGLAREKGLILKSEIAPGTPPLFCDSRQYGRVLGNLVSNAVKYTDAGGTIAISVKARAPGAVVTSVGDTGMGIPRDQQHLIFGKFDQIKRAEGQQRPGSGLGLLLCRQLVELNGGTIGFESEEGKGSTFFYALPAYSEPVELAYMLHSVAENARSTGVQTVAYAFARAPVADAYSTLDRIGDAVRPLTSVHDALRTFPERKLVVLIKAQPRDSVKSILRECAAALLEARATSVVAASHICPDEPPEPEHLLAALQKKLRPIAANGT